MYLFINGAPHRYTKSSMKIEIAVKYFTFEFILLDSIFFRTTMWYETLNLMESSDCLIQGPPSNNNHTTFFIIADGIANVTSRHGIVLVNLRIVLQLCDGKIHENTNVKSSRLQLFSIQWTFLLFFPSRFTP